MNRTYKITFTLLRPLMAIFFPHRQLGRENIPKGPCIFCANHSSFIDPLLVIYAIWPCWAHIMAKLELFSVILVGFVLRHIAAVPVNRAHNDIHAVRESMRYLKSGGNLLVFPEGTRVSTDDAVAAKSGAVRLAVKLETPLVPIYIPRGKHLFRRTEVRIGAPYYVAANDRRPHEELAEELMEKIRELAPVKP